MLFTVGQKNRIDNRQTDITIRWLRGEQAWSREFTPGGTPRNSWWVCAAQFSKSWPYFIPKTVIFYTRFHTRPLKSKPFFRPGIQTEIMSSFFRLERKQTISPNAYPIRKFLLRSYSFGVETINKFIHPRSSIENHTRFQIKMGKEYTRFQTRKDKKPYTFGQYTSIWLI